MIDYNQNLIPIIIPSYEPDAALLDLCQNLYDAGYQNVIIVNDGSDPSFDGLFDQIAENYHYTILRHAINLGKGRALKDAFNYALCENKCIGVITADSDGQHKPEDIARCMEEMVKHPEALVLGTRVFNGDEIPWKSKLGNVLTSKLFRYLCGIELSDTQTGLRGIPRSLMEKCLSIHGERFDFETNVLLNANDEYQFVEVPIETVYESKTDHKTHFDPWKDSLMIYRLIFSYTLSSILSVILDFSVFTIMTNGGMNLWLATAIGRCTSTVSNFVINRNAVFKSKGNPVKQLLKYLLLVCVSGTLSALSVSAISTVWNENVVIIKAIVEGLLFFFNYYVQRGFVFSKKRN